MVQRVLCGEGGRRSQAAGRRAKLTSGVFPAGKGGDGRGERIKTAGHGEVDRREGRTLNRRRTVDGGRRAERGVRLLAPWEPSAQFSRGGRPLEEEEAPRCRVAVGEGVSCPGVDSLTCRSKVTGDIPLLGCHPFSIQRQQQILVYTLQN